MKQFFSVILAFTMAISALGQDIDSMIGGMSRREKIAQIIIVAVDTQDRPERRASHEEAIRQGLGGVIVMDDVLAPCMEMLNHYQAAARIPLLVSIDGEWGASMRFYEYASFPKAMQMGALPNEELVYQAGKAVGEELSQIKIFADYAPDIDINNNPNNPVIGVRSFGEDREKVAIYGSAFMRGMKDAGVAGSAKHFPGHGDTDVDSHKGLPVLTFDRKRLDSLELHPFRQLIADGVDMVMVGHLSVPALDPSGTPASISEPIITGLLRNEMGFKGIIITDALGMKGVATDYGDASVAAYKAGADILLMPQDALKTIDDLDALFADGTLDEAGLDARVRKVLELKARRGMLKPDYNRFVDPSEAIRSSYRPQTEALIQKISDESMTVVCGAERLPLKAGRTAYVAINAATEQSEEFFLELGKQYFPADRFRLDGDFGQAEVDALCEKLKGYDQVIIGFHSGEPVRRSGGPRRESLISPEQFKAVSALTKEIKNVTGVLFANPYRLIDLQGWKDFSIFIVAYSDTAFNNRAAARAIVKGSAKGKLPVSIEN